MKIIDGKLVLENKQCYSCMGDGHAIMTRPCPTCKGTGKGKRGGRGGCLGCHGHGKKYGPDRDPNKVCGQCEGTKLLAETIYDQMPSEFFANVEIKINRDPTKSMGFNEQYLGIGFIVCTTDYGDAWKNNDDAKLIANIRKSHHSQACEYINRETMEVIHGIMVTVNRSGYTGKGYFLNGTTPQEEFTDATANGLFPGYSQSRLNAIVS